MGFGMFDIMERLFPIFFIAVFGVILFAIVRSIMQWSKNNNSPVLAVQARVVNMRQDTRMGSGHMETHTASTTRYYATFQVESGDRMELSVPGKEYGLLAQGDTGRLTFQGTRYLSFQRIP